jgi:hypothetical protein
VAEDIAQLPPSLRLKGDPNGEIIVEIINHSLSYRDIVK